MCNWYSALVCQRTTDCDHGMNLATDSDECEPRGCMRLRWGLQIADQVIAGSCFNPLRQVAPDGIQGHTPSALPVCNSKGLHQIMCLEYFQESRRLSRGSVNRIGSLPDFKLDLRNRI